MKLHDIENLSFAELKEQRAEAITAALESPVDELATRYIQARTDAKMRDATLSEQGQTIATLNAALASSGEEVARLRAELENIVTAAATAAKESKATADKVAAEHAAAIAWSEAAVEKLQDMIDQKDAAAAELAATLAAERERSARLKAEACRHHKAVVGAAQLLNAAISAQAIDNAAQPSA